MFFEDALTVSRELELTLTGKNCGLPKRAPMCGIPHQAADTYIQKLVDKGYKVAICEQVESPFLAKGVVKREVVRITTPGTVIESTMLPEGENNYIGSVYLAEKGVGVCFADISTGEMQFAEFIDADPAKRLIDELSRFSPRELIGNPAALGDGQLSVFISRRLNCVQDAWQEEDYRDEAFVRQILSQFRAASLSDLGLDGRGLALRAVGSLLAYLTETQMEGIKRLTSLTCYTGEQYLSLDLTARRNLELTETMRSREKKGSLLWVIDRTRTAMGKRLMRKYLEQPLLNVAHITKRQEAVAELYNETVKRGDLTDGLSGIYDLQRLMTKVVYGTVGPRDLLSLATAASRLPQIKEVTRTLRAPKLQELDRKVHELTEVRELIEKAIDPDCPPTMKDGGVIRKGYSSELDEITDLRVNAKGYLSKMEEREKEKTGIKTLKIGYNRVFGYYIEVSRSFIGQVPKEWIRKQTLVGGERYITEELKELENRMLSATERQLALEAELFESVRKAVQVNLSVIEETASAVAELDVLASLAEVAVQNRYIRPDITLSGTIHITGGRHQRVDLRIVGADSLICRRKGLFRREQTGIGQELPQSGVFLPGHRLVVECRRDIAAVVIVLQCETAEGKLSAVEQKAAFIKTGLPHRHRDGVQQFLHCGRFGEGISRRAVRRQRKVDDRIHLLHPDLRDADPCRQVQSRQRCFSQLGRCEGRVVGPGVNGIALLLAVPDTDTNQRRSSGLGEAEHLCDCVLARLR